MGDHTLILDVMALIIECIVIVSVHYKHMTEGQENRTFLNVQIVAIILTLLDLSSEFFARNLEGSLTRLTLATVLTYGYLLVRFLFPVVYLIFILSEAGVLYKLESFRYRLLVFGFYTFIVILIFANNFTQEVFTISLANGYHRGTDMILIFVIGFLYYMVGLVILTYCRRFMDKTKWLCLLLTYFVGIMGAVWQAANEGALVEAMAYAIMILMSHLFIQRPEEVVDFSVDIYSWWQYREHLKRCKRADHPLKVLVLRFVNATEVRALLGELAYNNYVRNTAQNIRRLMGNDYGLTSMYYGPMGCIIIVFDDVNAPAEELVPKIEEYHELKAAEDNVPASVMQLRMAIARFLIDITHVEGMVNFSVTFPRFLRQGQNLLPIEQIANNPDVKIRNQSVEIIARALERHYFEMYYQPIYNVKTGKFTSAEALIRLNDPKFGFVPPETFISEAEHFGYMKPIGQFVLENVFAFLGEIQASALGLDYMEINLSVQQCVQKNLVQVFSELEQKYEVDPRYVNLEVTETMSALNPKAMIRNIKALSERGYRFSLDDYGTGFSNIVRVIHLPMDLVKIDKSLIALLDEERCQNIVADTIHMMHRNHMRVVCEGVETEEQAKLLASMDCDFIQGFYYCEPLPKEDFLAFIRQHNT